MDHMEAMDILSECGLGAVIAARDDLVLEANAAADRLLHAEGGLKGMALRDAAPFLLDGGYGNPAFNEYLLPCPAPRSAELPEGTRLLVFRDATKDFTSELMTTAIGHVSEAITMYDDSTRLLMINGEAEKLEAHLSEDVVGKPGSALFKPGKDSILAIPLALSEKRPILNLRQDFVTHLGRELQVVSSSYPVMRDGRALGVVCMQENLSTLNELHQRIDELQSSLAGMRNEPKVKSDSAMSAKYRFSDIIYSDPAIGKLIEKCRMVARSDSSVMIYGETGTGKELFAQSIHNAGSRREHPFIGVNCAAIPDALLEGILFGTEKGAYTGSTQRKGLLEQAHMGTVLLDEINSMDIRLQPKLLRFLQDGVIRRIGGLNNVHVDVRVITNINVPPMQAIEQNLLRSDLYYRLGAVSLTIPPLRDRRGDIPLLAKTFLLSGCKKLGRSATGFSPSAMRALCEHDWPGNVRELQHAVESALNIMPPEAQYILPEHLPEHILRTAYRAGDGAEGPRNLIKQASQDAARRIIAQLLSEQGGNITKAAKAAGVTRQNFQHYMKTLSMD